MKQPFFRILFSWFTYLEVNKCKKYNPHHIGTYQYCKRTLTITIVLLLLFQIQIKNNNAFGTKYCYFLNSVKRLLHRPTFQLEQTLDGTLPGLFVDLIQGYPTEKSGLKMRGRNLLIVVDCIPRANSKFITYSYLS